MNDQLAGLLNGALLADAITLGAHWIYDPKQIEQSFGDVQGFTDPAENTYHKDKEVGDFTHYGDQMMILVDSIQEHGEYLPDMYMRKWEETMKDYAGYMDHATKETLENIQASGDYLRSGSKSFDGSAIGRIAPLIAFGDFEEIELSLGGEDGINILAGETSPDMISEFIGFTHAHEAVKDGGVYIADVVGEVLGGLTPTEAIEKSLTENEDIQKFITQAQKSLEKNTIQAIQEMGPACGIDGVFQGALHCILKYQEDFKKALLENTKAGGDSAARGMIIGMVLGAYHGNEGLPGDWLEVLASK